MKLTSRIKNNKKTGILIAGSLIILGVIYMYMQWTREIGSAFVEGVQGRYFTPLILLPALCLAYNNREGKSFEGTWYYLLIAACCLIAAADIVSR